MDETRVANFLLYNSEDGKAQVRILVDGETCWLSQKLMAELFETTVANINQHVKHVLIEGELDADSVIKDYLIAAADGKSYRTKHYRQKIKMGLTSWKNAPDGPVRKADVVVAKNYLQEDELAALNRIVTMYLDYAEDQAQRQKPMTMRAWAEKLDAFLAFNDRPVLSHTGSIQKKVADTLALEQYEAFSAFQQTEIDAMPSDFDRLVQGLKKLPKPDGEKHV